MNILQLIHSSAPTGGGPIESVLQSARALRPLGHEVELVCLDDPDGPWLADLGVTVHALGPARPGYRYAPRLAPWLRRELPRFDAAIVNGIWLYPSFAARRACLAAGVPYFVYTHGMLDPALRRVFPGKHAKKWLLWKLVESRVLRDARAVLFTCEEERRLAAQSFRPFQCRGEIVPYCVGEPPGDGATQARVFLDRYPELRDRRRLLFLSRIHPKKGGDLLVRAFASAAALDERLCLVMAGPDDGAQPALARDARERGVAERILWTGMLTGDMKWGAFHSAEAFVLPSHQENFGIAVVEALACGVPVLTSRRVNIWREIEADGAGWAAEDTQKETDSMLARWICEPEPARLAMRQAARLCFETRFRSAAAAARLLEVLGAGASSIDPSDPSDPLDTRHSTLR